MPTLVGDQPGNKRIGSGKWSPRFDMVDRAAKQAPFHQPSLR